MTGLPDHDFWLFDDRDVSRMRYTADGAFIGGELLSADRFAEYQGPRRGAHSRRTVREPLGAAPLTTDSIGRALRALR